MPMAVAATTSGAVVLPTVPPPAVTTVPSPAVTRVPGVPSARPVPEDEVDTMCSVFGDGYERRYLAMVLAQCSSIEQAIERMMA